MIVVDPQLKNLTESLRHSGVFWQERLTTQRPFARQVAAVCGWAGTANAVSQAGDWLLGKKTDTALRVINIPPSSVIGPDFWPVEKTGVPGFGAPLTPSYERDRPYLLENGTVVVLAAGSGAVPDYFIPSQQTVWFVPLPKDMYPVALIAADRTLCEGTGFMVAGSWLMLYSNPIALWPAGAVPALCRLGLSSPRSGALAANNLRTDGRALASYRRHSQSLRRFEAAACEAAGICVLDADGIVARMETGSRGVLHWLEDGRSFVLPSSPYAVGSTVAAGDGHVLQLLHPALQGTDWWRGRSWNALGIPVFSFRQGFDGFAFRDEMVTAFSYRDADGGLRARMALNQYQEGEDAFWAWLAMQERRRGTETFARGILGFTDADQHTQVNALGTMLEVCGGWFGVIETNLDATDPVAFRNLLDFVERERPAGTQIHVRGTDSSYSFQIYLDTGELVLDGDASVAMPAWY